MKAGGNIAVDANRQSFLQWVVWILVGAAGGCATTSKESARYPNFLESDNYVDVKTQCEAKNEATRWAITLAKFRAEVNCPRGKYIPTGFDSDTQKPEGTGCYVASLRLYFRCADPPR